VRQNKRSKMMMRNPIKLAVKRTRRRKRSEGIEGGVRLTGR
jgi:hypothetical protein